MTGGTAGNARPGAADPAGGDHGARWQTGRVRIPAKVDYAIRALAELAVAGDGPVKAEQIAEAQDIPLTFLRDIMRELKRDRIVRSLRGPDGGFVLGPPRRPRSPSPTSSAPSTGPSPRSATRACSAMTYQGAAAELPEVWMAVRASLRRVLETTTVADLADGTLPAPVTRLAEEYRTTTEARWAAGDR